MIKPKNKPCVSCGRNDLPHFSRQRCLPCSKKAYNKPKPISDKRKVQLKEYSELRIEFLKAHPLCQAKLVGCNKIANQVHHANKRFGERLNDTKHWVALCPNCHCQIEDSMSAAEAIENGLRVKQKPNG